MNYLRGCSNVEYFAEKCSAVSQVSACRRRLLHFIINLRGLYLGLILLTEQHIVEECLSPLQLHVVRLFHEDGGAASGPHR